MPEAMPIFYCCRLRERKSREISLFEIFPSLLVQVGGSSRASSEKVAFKLPTLKMPLASDSSCRYEFQPRTTSQIGDADVCAASEIGWAFSTCTKETIAKERPSRLCSD